MNVYKTSRCALSAVTLPCRAVRASPLRRAPHVRDPSSNETIWRFARDKLHDVSLAAGTRVARFKKKNRAKVRAKLKLGATESGATARDTTRPRVRPVKSRKISQRPKHEEQRLAADNGQGRLSTVTYTVTIQSRVGRARRDKARTATGQRVRRGEARRGEERRGRRGEARRGAASRRQETENEAADGSCIS